MLDSFRELIDLLAATPAELREAAEGAGPAPEGEWNAAQILAHMAAAEHFFFERLTILLNQEHAYLKSFAEAATTRQSTMTNNTWEENLEAFNAIRGETVSLLMGMTLAEWERSGIHETLGRITVEDVAENMVDHDAEHVEQLEGLG
jgi:hypothetical protein